MVFCVLMLMACLIRPLNYCHDIHWKKLTLLILMSEELRGKQMLRNTGEGHIGLMPLFLYRQSWKQLPEPYQMCRNIASGYNKCHSQDNQYDSATQSECQTFPEDRYSEEYSRYRFQSSEDGCRGRTYILHGLRRTEEGYGCREDCQCNQVPP